MILPLASRFPKCFKINFYRRAAFLACMCAFFGVSSLPFYFPWFTVGLSFRVTLILIQFNSMAAYRCEGLRSAAILTCSVYDNV